MYIRSRSSAYILKRIDIHQSHCRSFHHGSKNYSRPVHSYRQSYSFSYCLKGCCLHKVLQTCKKIKNSADKTDILWSYVWMDPMIVKNYPDMSYLTTHRKWEPCVACLLTAVFSVGWTDDVVVAVGIQWGARWAYLISQVFTESSGQTLNTDLSCVTCIVSVPGETHFKVIKLSNITQANWYVLMCQFLILVFLYLLLIKLIETGLD